MQAERIGRENKPAVYKYKPKRIQSDAELNHMSTCICNILMNYSYNQAKINGVDLLTWLEVNK